MTTDTPPRAVHPADLPGTVRTFLAAHQAREAEAALRTFDDDPVVVDDGRTFRGTAEVLAFLRDAGSEFTYTTEVISARREDETHWAVVHRLEGDFPGNVVELTYRFTLTADLISELVIG